MGWYDRKVRRVRDLSCGDTRIFLELDVRRASTAVTRRIYLHLSYSCASPFGPAILVTHDPTETLAVKFAVMYKGFAPNVIASARPVSLAGGEAP